MRTYVCHIEIQTINKMISLKKITISTNTVDNNYNNRHKWIVFFTLSQANWFKIIQKLNYYWKKKKMFVFNLKTDQRLWAHWRSEVDFLLFALTNRRLHPTCIPLWFHRMIFLKKTNKNNNKTPEKNPKTNNKKQQISPVH